MMKQFFAAAILCLAIALPLSAQEVAMPDLNLQRVVRSALSLNPNQPITRADMITLERLVAPRHHNIIDLTGLEHAVHLNYLVLSGNDIYDLTPLQNLIKLEHLALGENRIADLSPLEGLTQLEVLHLSSNRVIDVSPLAHLSMLRKLHLSNNLIADVSPLANLKDLIELEIRTNPALDYSTLSAIPYVTYDECCEVEPLPVRDRITNRDYPSVGTIWGGNKAWIDALNRPGLTKTELTALHDLWLFGTAFYLKTKHTGDGVKIVGSLREAREVRDEHLALNPNLIFIKEIRLRDLGIHLLPPDSPYWLRDESGNIVVERNGTRGLYDFTRPAVQERILSEVRAVDRCGFFDGIFFDWWNDNDQVLGGYRTREQEQRARESIIMRVRAETRPDFLVFVNAGPRTIPLTGPFVNGTFMETSEPRDKPTANMPSRFKLYEDTLSWSESNMRMPRINLLEGWANPNEPADSPMNRRWMRAFTTLSLTHSDGYTLFTNGLGHRHLWYDFWDADLGKPVGEKGQLYEDIEGLYIREFTNGWAVYNNSGAEQTVTLPELATGVASGVEGMEHTLPDLDGEMFLRVKPANPADVNSDGLINIFDLTLVAQAIGTGDGEGDVNGDGVVNVFDLVFVAEAF